MEQSQCTSQIPLRPRDDCDRIPLTAWQMRVWRSTESGGTRLRECPTSVRCVGPLDRDLLRAAMQTVLHRHESLRTRFVNVDGSPEQRVDAPTEYQLDVVDLSHIPSSKTDQEVRRAADELMREKIDLSAGPLFAARLFKLSGSAHVLFCALDHMISDGISLGILDREIWTLYWQGAQGKPLLLPSLTLQFGDYTVWQQKNYAPRRREHEEYWRTHLDGTRPLRIPCGSGVSEVRSTEGARFHWSFGAALSDGLRDIALREHAKLPLVVCTVYVAVMLRWCSKHQAILGFASHKRYCPELRTMIGFIAGVLYLRAETSAGDTFSGLLTRISSELHSARSHDDFGHVPDFMSDCEATQLVFNWVPGYAGDGYLPADLSQSTNDKVRILPFSYRTITPCSFRPTFSHVGGEISVLVNFVPDIFPKCVVERFTMNLRLFAEQFVNDPGAQIGLYQ